MVGNRRPLSRGRIPPDLVASTRMPVELETQPFQSTRDFLVAKPRRSTYSGTYRHVKLHAIGDLLQRRRYRIAVLPVGLDQFSRGVLGVLE